MKEINKEIRYSRNLAVADFTMEMQEKLFASSVLVVGAGGLGSAVINYLSAVGVGRIGIVEFDTVSESNLQRQILYSENDLGKSKGEIALQRVRERNANCEAIFYNIQFDEKNGIEIAKSYDIVVDCSDNYAARYAIDGVCVQLSIPFVYGSAEQLSGQISTFNLKNGKSYRELYSTPPCEKNEIIGVLSPMPGIIGAMQALEVIKLLLDFSDNLSGKLLLFDGNTYQISIFTM